MLRRLRLTISDILLSTLRPKANWVGFTQLVSTVTVGTLRSDVLIEIEF
jgi:hypothetical protein